LHGAASNGPFQVGGVVLHNVLSAKLACVARWAQ
jgi:hypothetical protein